MKTILLTVSAIILATLVLLFGRYVDQRLQASKRVFALRPAITVTLREGLNRQEIARNLAAAGVVDAPSFLAATSADEGYLFPDTYQFYPNSSAGEVRQKLIGTFTEKLAALSPTRDQIILASIVEREAKGDADRGQIAGVYHNRLKRGMKLEADPTVQYGKYTELVKAPSVAGGLDYWAPITLADYQTVVSPFNTYLHTGLPPTPICNPGLKSLAAAVSPATTSALYFFHTKDGTAIFSSTLKEHDAQLRQYR